MSDVDRARAALVDGLVATGRIRSAAVEDAFRAVPRHLFLPDAAPATAYADDAVAVQRVGGVPTSSASQPSMVAVMLEQLDLRPGQRVLEIGAGTGWNAALTARIVGASGQVTTVDIDPHLVDSAGRHLAAAGVTGVRLRCGDGVAGEPDGAPYDRIVLTVGSDDVWPAWVAQLAPGGRLLLPLAVRGSQLSAALDLGPDGVLRSHSLRSCGFIRMRGPGAVDDRPVALPGGGALWTVPGGPGADPAAVAAALADPREAAASPVGLGPADVRDGFGLWLALTEPGAGRLLADPGGELPAGLGAGSAVPVLVTPPDAAAPGLAAAVPGPRARVPAPQPGGEPGRGPAGGEVRVFGPGGAELGRRLHRALDAWAAAGAPGGPDWALTVVPDGVPAPAAGAVTVRTPHARLLLEPQARGSSTTSGISRSVRFW
ncbi:methyltransferase domain-containing protein [Pseudonocardia petroleophila]|uniref:Protein-L-isoaspartate O-methyltransferase n=1 Tax=Pseudonocardia petroleophila TaxID=37331 RepID=A0A7G7MQY2_9PSEU|nr:methyltransferase domain-containing protein [Pseudonocardia petroleophila]QNG55193.1 methyltransferase domain-containing protein [Pseudonocardia petroleophila]